MPANFVRVYRIALVLSIVGVGWPTFSAARAEERPASPSATELERRVRELEEIVRQLQAERQQPVPLSTAAPTANQPKQPLPPVASPPAEVEVAPHPRTVPSEPSLPFGPGLPIPEKGTGLPLPPRSVDGLGLESRRVGGADDRSKAPPGSCAGWDDGFFLCSPDKAFVFRITGQLQADYRDYLDSGDTTDIDTFLIRRARLGIEAKVFNFYEFRLMPDFGQDRTRLLDAYLNVHYWDAFQVEVGKFKQPFSYEQLIQDRFVPTMERSLIDQLVPARDIGVTVHGQKLLGDCLDYAIGVSNGEINGDRDTNDAKDVNGRIALRPFRRWDLLPGLQGLQLGISGGTGIEDEPVNPNTLRTPAGVRWFQYLPSVQADGLRTRWSPEVAYFCGPFGFAAQYFRQDQEVRPNSTGRGARILVDVPAEGYYFLTTYLLTGEERTTYSQAITPLRPFDPLHPLAAPGAWELVLRLSRLKLGDEVFAPGLARLADPARFSNGTSELTVGFNWYLNRWVRTQLNWEHAWFDDPVQLGTGLNGRLKEQDTLMVRFQIQ